MCPCVCAERASAPPFGHSDADKCCTRIPNTFLSLAAAARANVNAAAAADAAAAPCGIDTGGGTEERAANTSG